MNYKYSNINLIRLLFGVTIIVVVASCSKTSDESEPIATTNCPSKNCSDFSTQSSAQTTFNSNRTCYKSLDSDGDGVACETLP